MSSDEPTLGAPTGELAARFWRDFLKPQGAKLGVAALLMAMVAAANTSYALVVRETGKALEAQSSQAIWIAPLLIVAVTAAKAIALFAQMALTQSIALKTLEGMQARMYGRLLEADFARLSGEAAGRLAARFTSDVERVREALTRAATNLLRDALTVVGGVAVMLYVDWLLAVLVLCVYPLAMQPVINLGHRLRKASRAAQEQMGDLTAFLNESFDGARLVKTYGLEAYQTRRGGAAFAERYRLGMKIARGRAGVEPILEVAGGLAFAGVLAFAAWRMTNTDFSIADLLAFITALGVMAPAVRAIGTLNAVAQEGFAAVERVFAVIDEEPAVIDPPGSPALQVSRAHVAFEGVTFRYAGTERPALTDLSFSAEPGKTTALVGPSGAGKSSVINLIPRLYDPTAGRVVIDGQDIASVSLDSLRRNIALVSQDATLFDDTIAANIAFGRPDASAQDIRAAAQAAAATVFIEATPEGFDTQVGPGGSRLSGGQRQRIALARAFLKDAPILLLDEPTSALDAEAEAQIQAALDRLASGRTTIVIAHRLATIRRADRIYVLDQGRVVEEGDDADLTARGGLYARLRALQFTDHEHGDADKDPSAN